MGLSHHASGFSKPTLGRMHLLIQGMFFPGSSEKVLPTVFPWKFQNVLSTVFPWKFRESSFHRVFLEVRLIIQALIISTTMNPIILNFLWLGNDADAYNIQALRDNEISHILVCGAELKQYYPDQFVYHQIDVYDNKDTSLISHWETTTSFLEHARACSGKVLVHCAMGISRSVSVVAAFLMKSMRLDVDEALYYIKLRRPVADPIAEFVDQLRLFEAGNYCDDGTTASCISNRHANALQAFRHKISTVDQTTLKPHVEHLLLQADALPRGEDRREIVRKLLMLLD